MDQNEVKIEVTAFTMWLDKFQSIRGVKNEYLTYWELYDVWLTHDKRQTYLDHVRRSIIDLKR